MVMVRSPLALRGFGRARAALLSLGVVSLLLACSTTPTAKKEEKLCPPGGYVFCRCRDRQEGTKLCKDDGQSFGLCEPCETFDNPEDPLDPDDPDPYPQYPRPDAGDGGSTPGACGNGIVETGEDCDDENAEETDGCDSNCRLAGATPSNSNSCPGLDVHVWGGAHKPSLASTTVGSGNRSVAPNCTATSNPTTGINSPDRVFKVTAHKTGLMKVVTSDVNYNVFLWASEECKPSGNSFIACVNESGSVGPEGMTFPVENGKSYHVFIDGSGLEKREGSFRVTFSIP